MPQFSSQRVFEPWSLAASVSFDEADLTKAFIEGNSPTNSRIEELYYAIFSNAWLKIPLSQQLLYLAEVARLIEIADGGPGGPKATKVVATLGEPIPK